MSIAPRHAERLPLIDEAIRLYGFPAAVVCLFSGGNDSLTATHLTMRDDRTSFAAHINTGIGIPETREFVKQTCEKYGWPLKVYSAADQGQHYRDLVVSNGFPGPGAHGWMYRLLKERALRQCVRDAKRRRRERVFLVSGCRSDESTRRMGTVEPIQRQGAQVWIAPIHDWTKDRCLEYLDENNVEQNPVCDKLGMSGECLCGAFAHPGELDNICFHYPDYGAYIKALERDVRAAGHDWGWNDRPQTKRTETVPDGQSLCHSCGKQ